MIRIPILVATALLFGSAAPAEPISVSISAWGQRLAEWRIDPDGAIVSTVMDPARPGASPTYKLVTRRAPAAPDRYPAIVAMLRPTQRWAGKALPCKRPITDADSGTVRWSKTVALDYYSGCTEALTRGVVKRVYAANQQIAIWTKDAPITDTRTIGPGQ